MSPPRLPHPVLCTLQGALVEQTADVIRRLRIWIEETFDTHTPSVQALLAESDRVGATLLAVLRVAESRLRDSHPRTAAELDVWLAVEAVIAETSIRLHWNADEFHAIQRMAWVALPGNFASWAIYDAELWARRFVIDHVGRPQRPASGSPAVTEFTPDEAADLERARRAEMLRRGERDT